MAIICSRSNRSAYNAVTRSGYGHPSNSYEDTMDVGMNNKTSIAKSTIAISSGALLVLVGIISIPSSSGLTSAWAWSGTEGCTPGYWKNHLDTNTRAQDLEGINLNEAILDITGLNLGAPADLTIDQAVTLKGGGLNALYRALGAAVFNTYYGVDDLDYIEPSTLAGFVQLALDGDVEGAINAIDAANNLGCPLN